MQIATARMLVVLLLWTTSCPIGIMSAQPEKSLEITTADIFAAKNWDSRDLNVLGVKLGILRNDAIKITRQGGMRLLNSAPPLAGRECSQDLCSIYTGEGAAFVDVVFGQDARIAEIRMDLYIADGPGVTWIGKQLKGDSRGLASHYSDELRLKLMGHEDIHCAGNPSAPRPMVQSYSHSYDYKKRGVIFEIGTVEQGYPLNLMYPVVQVEVRLVIPEK